MLRESGTAPESTEAYTLDHEVSRMVCAVSEGKKAIGESV
jgi:hypothetical protein